MTTQEIEALCMANRIDFMHVDAADPRGEGVILRWKNPRDPDDPEKVHLTLKAVEDIMPQDLLKAVVNGRDVFHVTRIVGYYSHTENWNKSKLGELKHRHEGNYHVG